MRKVTEKVLYLISYAGPTTVFQDLLDSISSVLDIYVFLFSVFSINFREPRANFFDMYILIGITAGLTKHVSSMFSSFSMWLCSFFRFVFNRTLQMNWCWSAFLLEVFLFVRRGE